MSISFLKMTIISIFFAMIIMPILSFSLTAQAAPADPWGGGAVTKEEIRTEAGLGDRDPRLIVSSVINVILGFLGILALGLIVYAGFTWMTAGGNEEKIETAQKILKAAIIGLIIILASWGIANFVVSAVMEATTS